MSETDPLGGYLKRRNTCEGCATPLLNVNSRRRGICINCWTRLDTRQRAVRERLIELKEMTT